MPSFDSFISRARRLPWGGVAENRAAAVSASHLNVLRPLPHGTTMCLHSLPKMHAATTFMLQGGFLGAERPIFGGFSVRRDLSCSTTSRDHEGGFALARSSMVPASPSYEEL